MEKFTVDLEKVLDDFEFSEERDERKSVSSKNNTVRNQFSTSKNVAPNNYEYATPGVYKRTAFEPINLAEADYSAAVQPSQQAAPSSRSNTTFVSQPPSAKGLTGQYNPGHELGNHFSSPHHSGNASSTGFVSQHHPGKQANAGYVSHQTLGHVTNSGYTSQHASVNTPSTGYVSQQTPGHVTNSSFSSQEYLENASNSGYTSQQPAGNFQSSGYASQKYPGSETHLTYMSQRTPGNEVSTSYVFPHIASGSNVILKSPNGDVELGGSGMKERRDLIYAHTPSMDLSLDNVLSSSPSSSSDEATTSPGLGSSSSRGEELKGKPLPPDVLEPRLSLPDVATPSTRPQPAEAFDLINDRVLNALGDSSSSDARPVSEDRSSVPPAKVSKDGGEAWKGVPATEAFKDRRTTGEAWDSVPASRVSNPSETSPGGAWNEDSPLVGADGASGGGVVGFHAVAKPVLSESELNKYLDELEDEVEENSVEEVSSLPIVSTDDGVSSSQSQLDENSSSGPTTSGATSSGGTTSSKPTPGAGNGSEFDNLLSPAESSTASSNLVPPSESPPLNQGTAANGSLQSGSPTLNHEVNSSVGLDSESPPLKHGGASSNHGPAISNDRGSPLEARGNDFSVTEREMRTERTVITEGKRTSQDMNRASEETKVVASREINRQEAASVAASEYDIHTATNSAPLDGNVTIHREPHDKTQSTPSDENLVETSQQSLPGTFTATSIDEVQTEPENKPKDQVKTEESGERNVVTFAETAGGVFETHRSVETNAEGSTGRLADEMNVGNDGILNEFNSGIKNAEDTSAPAFGGGIQDVGALDRYHPSPNETASGVNEDHNISKVHSNNGDLCGKTNTSSLDERQPNETTQLIKEPREQIEPSNGAAKVDAEDDQIHNSQMERDRFSENLTGGKEIVADRWEESAVEQDKSFVPEESIVESIGSVGESNRSVAELNESAGKSNKSVAQLNESVGNVQNTTASNDMDGTFTDEPTEILNSKYVVEISQPRLLVDQSKSKTSPEKHTNSSQESHISSQENQTSPQTPNLPMFIPDSVGNVPGIESNTGRKRQELNENVSEVHTSVTNDVPQETEAMRQVDDGNTSGMSLRGDGASDMEVGTSHSTNETVRNSPEQVTTGRNDAFSEYGVEQTATGTNNVNIYREDASKAIGAKQLQDEREASDTPINSTLPGVPEVADKVTNKYSEHFVHNDLEMVREKNTNLHKQGKSFGPPCITVSNLKTCDQGEREVGASQSAETSQGASQVGIQDGGSSLQGGVQDGDYKGAASPDCYIEEKSIADSIGGGGCESGMVHSNAVVEGGQLRSTDASTSSVSPAQGSNSQPPEPIIQVEHPSPSSTSRVTSPKPVRPNSLDLPSSPSVSLSPSETPPNLSDSEPVSSGTQAVEAGVGPPPQDMLGRRAPYWVPDTEAPACMHCQGKFTLVKRRHHCRACGHVLCGRCCNRKAPLEYLQFSMERVCLLCYDILEAPPTGQQSHPPARQPNPNNPMEYCSTIPPLQQMAQGGSQPPPSVLVPVSVLKREGSLKAREGKQVMFSDGIKPGGDLTELDAEEVKLPIVRKNRSIKRVGTPPGHLFHKRPLHPDTNSFIPAVGIPPAIVTRGGDVSYSEVTSPLGLNEASVKFAIHRNLYAHVRKVRLDCCMGKKKVAWSVTSEGLTCVGQDEVVFLLACTPGEVFPPQHIFHVILYIYTEAAQGSIVKEMCFLPSPPSVQDLLGSKDHGGFLFLRRTTQCTTHLPLPDPPYLLGVLVHRWEIPWAKLFPLRLLLRLGAAYKCYPCPLLSVRFREPVYMEVGHTIIELLVDFRSYAYSMPSVRGLLIHMEETKTSVIIPRNYYDQVVKAINYSNDSYLAFAGNFSSVADAHLVCVQNLEVESSKYTTQRFEATRPGEAPVTDPPRSCTGLAFILFNVSLKSSDGMAGKACISEDGLMVHLLPEGMVSLRSALHDMRDYCVPCGPHGEESVHIVWGPQDLAFNVGVRSCIDGKPLDGVQSIRVHGGTDYTGGHKLIRWTEVFIIENSDLNVKTTEDPIDHMKKLSENISRATCVSLVPLLESLAAASVTKFGVRVTIHLEDVGYEAGTGGERFDARYMRHLDEGLVPIIHQAAVHSTSPLTLELVFRVMEQG